MACAVGAASCVAVPREAIEDLYEQWNDVAEGFGIDKEENSEIFSVLQETLDLPKKPLAALSELLFNVYDTDNVRASAADAHLPPLPRSCASLCRRTSSMTRWKCWVASPSRRA
jgi:hypothetical protein